MEDQSHSENSVFDLAIEEDKLIEVENGPKVPIKEKKKSYSKSKRLNKLEYILTNILLDPMDSEARKRYIRRWLYGEQLKNKDKRYIK